MGLTRATAFTFISVSIISAAVISFLSRRKKGTKSKVAGVVSELVIYPIKGIPGLRIERATCTEIGLRYRNVTDRQFMLVRDNKYIGLRDELSLINVHLKYDLDNDYLVLSAPGMTELTISLQPPTYDPSLVKSVIWYDKTEVQYMEVDKEKSTWFTKFLGKECLLVTSVSEIRREINPNYTYNNPVARHPNSRISFPNSHPYLLIHQSSLDKISNRINEQLTNQSFRGSIVISQPNKSEQLPAYDEDEWAKVSLGSKVVLFSERPCPRCTTINIDYQHQQLRTNKEPTTSLLKYRRGNKGKDKYVPMFGSNASLIAGGSVEVGDVVTVTYKA